MKAAKADTSGIFDNIQMSWAKQPTRVNPNNFHLSPRGLTFRSPARVAPWTEMDIDLEVPVAGGKHRRIECSGVVVQCEPSRGQSGFDITLLFIDLSKRAAAEISKLSRQRMAPAAHRSVTQAGLSA
jgi:hypothetical protein